MAEYKLALEQRSETGKKLKNLRAAGKIPAVVYGNGEPILTAGEYVATEKVLNLAGYHSPIDLSIAGKAQLAIVKDVQVDPVSRKIVNIEFQAISANAEVTATTPIVILNYEGSDASKIYHFAMTQSIEELEVKAKPADLPKELEIDASGLKALEDKITVGDLKLPKGVSLADKELDPAQVIASLYDPAAEAAAREAEAATSEGGEAAAEAPAAEASAE